MIEPLNCITGVIDGYGAIHCKATAYAGDCYHEKEWPTSYKRWRFYINDWELQISPCSEDMTAEECQKIEDFVRRRFTPPNWVIVGEIWEKHGRPRIGRKRKAYEKELEKRGLTGC